MLVHGAFSGAWSWGPLTKQLESAGHAVETFDLPGSGDDATPLEEVTLDAYADRVCAVLGEREEPAVLVARSMGGVAVTQAAARCPEKVATMVYVSAFVPQDGQSLLDLTGLPEGADDEVQANIVVEGDPPVGTMSPEAARNAFFEWCSDDVAEWALERQGTQAVVPFGQPVSVGEGAFDGIRRAYVICSRDRAIPPPLQRRMVEAAGITDVMEIDTDHSPHLSATAELGAALNRFAR